MGNTASRGSHESLGKPGAGAHRHPLHVGGHEEAQVQGAHVGTAGAADPHAHAVTTRTASYRESLTGAASATTAERAGERERRPVESEVPEPLSVPSLIPKTCRLARPYGFEITTVGERSYVSRVHPKGNAHLAATEHLINGRICVGDVIVGCDKLPPGRAVDHDVLIAALAAHESVTLQLIDAGAGQETALGVFAQDPAGALAAAAWAAAEDDLRDKLPVSTLEEAEGYVARLRAAVAVAAPPAEPSSGPVPKKRGPLQPGAEVNRRSLVPDAR